MKKKILFEKEKFTLKRKCSKKGCLKAGVYKAPKSENEIKNYIWFCEEHISSYNKKWNYCKNMTQKDLAQKINVKPAVINEYESGKAIPNPKTLNNIKKILGI